VNRLIPQLSLHLAKKNNIPESSPRCPVNCSLIRCLSVTETIYVTQHKTPVIKAEAALLSLIVCSNAIAAYPRTNIPSINSLLELAQINRNNSIILSSVRIDEIIYNAIHKVKTKYQGRKIIPRIQYPENENDLLVTGNPGLLEIAIKNVLDNACKFSDDEVGVEFQMTDTIIKITISDKGVGIPQNEINTIYYPFQRASNVKFIGGFGIGLSLVAKIIDLHGAKLDVCSTENEGTQFKLLFKRINL